MTKKRSQAARDTARIKANTKAGAEIARRYAKTLEVDDLSLQPRKKRHGSSRRDLERQVREQDSDLRTRMEKPGNRSMPAQKPGSSKQNYSTPREFIAAVEKRFGKIGFDLAATKSNTVATRYFSPDDDSLSKDWTKVKGSVLWLNPPYADIAPWAKKCASFESEGIMEKVILFLTPASVGSNWFAEHVFGRAVVLFLSPRMSFDGKHPYPKDLILSVFGFNPTTIGECRPWRWKP